MTDNNVITNLADARTRVQRNLRPALGNANGYTSKVRERHVPIFA